MNNHKIKWKIKWFSGNANIAGPMLQSEESGLRLGTMYDGLKIIFYLAGLTLNIFGLLRASKQLYRLECCACSFTKTVECLWVQCEALTQFLPESHLGESAGHGHLYYDPPDAEFLLGLQDPKVAMSYHS